MEIIARALQRARSVPPINVARASFQEVPNDRSVMLRDGSGAIDDDMTVELSPRDLLSKRVVAYDSNHKTTRSYDVLRNQLQTITQDTRSSLIAVAAPTAGCGTTTAAINLALSFSRVRGTSVLLVDANLRAPRIHTMLGLPTATSNTDVVQELALADVAGIQFHVFCPTDRIGRAPSKLDITEFSRQMDAIRRSLSPSVTIIDLPPMLIADEAASLASNADAVVLLLSVGQSKLSELEICKSYLGAKANIQVVLNKCRAHGL
jgi:Flp pilus assembly CpaE family ATPase